MTGSEKRAAALCISRLPPLILAGDAFTKSGFDGCIESAEAACNLIYGSTCAAPSSAGVEEQAAKAQL